MMMIISITIMITIYMYNIHYILYGAGLRGFAVSANLQYSNILQSFQSPLKFRRPPGARSWLEQPCWVIVHPVSVRRFPSSTLRSVFIISNRKTSN